MSFGLSRGRTLETTGYGLEAADLPPFEADDPGRGRVDPREWFPNPERRLELDVGCGKGTFLVQQARLDPAVNLLGIERAAEFYRYAADRARRHALENVRVLHADAVEFLRFRCPEAVIATIHLYFSDPWPKKRHHKRRVVQDRSLLEFHRVLAAGGELRLVTDHEDLWAWYEEHVARHEHLFTRQAYDAPVSAEAGEVAGTNFERKYRQEARPFRAMTLVKRPISPG